MSGLSSIVDDLSKAEAIQCRSTLKQFISGYPLKFYRKGQTVLLQNESPKGIYFIESGKVRTYTITPDGCEQLISIHSAGEDLPIGYMLGFNKEPQYFYEAYTKCVIRLVPRIEFLNHIKSNIECMYYLHVCTTSQLLSALSRINALEQPRASNKVILALLYMADRIGVRTWPQSAHLKLSMTQKEIANSLGMTRETACRELEKLRQKKLISYSRKTYLLYVERLQNYLNKLNDKVK